MICFLLNVRRYAYEGKQEPADEAGDSAVAKILKLERNHWNDYRINQEIDCNSWDNMLYKDPGTTMSGHSNYLDQQLQNTTSQEMRLVFFTKKF